jgi:predicted ferric reductase
LRIPALDAGPIEQIHPFTIAHYDEELRVASLFVRDMGRDTFTGLLARRVQQLPLLAVRVEGPYGSLQLNPHHADTIVSSGLLCLCLSRLTRTSRFLRAPEWESRRW